MKPRWAILGLSAAALTYVGTDELVRELSGLRESMQLLERSNRALEVQLAENTAAHSPVALAAANVDRVLELIEARQGRQAWAAFQGMRESVAYSSIGGFPAVALIDALTASFAALEDADAQVVDTQRAFNVRQASEALDALAAERARLVPGAVPWLAHGSDPGAAAPARLARIDALAGQAMARLGAARHSLLGTHDAERRAFVARGARQDPLALFFHAETYGEQCQVEGGSTCLQRVAARVAGHLRDAFQSGGTLVLPGLIDFAPLDGWGVERERWQDGVDAQSRATILAFWQAWIHYHPDPPAGRVADVALLGAEPVTDSTPRADWRAALALQLALGAPDSAFPAQAGRQSIYWRQASDGRDFWQTEELVAKQPAPGGSQGYWKLARHTYDVGGQMIQAPDPAYEITRWGERFRLDRSPTALLDLQGHGDGCRVARFESRFQGTLPANRLRATPEQVASFQDQLAGAAPACLVVTTSGPSGEVTRWFSPRYGLLREETPFFTRELIYASN